MDPQGITTADLDLPQQLLAQVTDSITVTRVFGEPIAHGDSLVVPVARIRGAAGGGSGTGPSGAGSDAGGSVLRRR